MAEEQTNGFKSGSNLEKMLRSGNFTVTGELGPPQGADPKEIAHKAGFLKGVVEAVNITDNQTAIVRMSSIGSAVLTMAAGVEPTVQMTCRDRNRLAIQSDLLGAYAVGARNLLCLTGDHQCFGNHPTAKNVHDLDSIQLIRMVKNMRDEGIFECGDAIKGEVPRFLIGAAINPFADPFDYRPYRLAKKVAAGVDFVQTQLIYDMPRFREFMKRVVDMGLHEKVYILAGIGPIKSVGAARYMRDKVPGMIVQDVYVERMQASIANIPKEDKAGRRDAQQNEGIKMCIEQIQELREIEGVAGVHIMAIEWEEAVRPIVEGAGLLPRPQV
ncbi:MAG: methylenetetrahydrofolate reductase [Anaerolineae bacterium]|nr:methylenetetrahydrofolate reductase [Anaerolineae bacterium]